MKVWIVESERGYTEAVYSNEAAAREHAEQWNANEAIEDMRAGEFEVLEVVPESLKAEITEIRRAVTEGSRRA